MMSWRQAWQARCQKARASDDPWELQEAAGMKVRPKDPHIDQQEQPQRGAAEQNPWDPPEDPHIIAQEQPQHEAAAAAEQNPWALPKDPHVAKEPAPFCAICSWRRARIISDDTDPGETCDTEYGPALDAVHTDPGNIWRAIINTNTLCSPTIYDRDDGMARARWARLPLRSMHQYLTSFNYWELHGKTFSPGEWCIAYHNTRVEHLLRPAIAWTGETIGNGILIDKRLCFGILTHGGHSGVKVYSDGGLATFDSQKIQAGCRSKCYAATQRS